MFDTTARPRLRLTAFLIGTTLAVGTFTAVGTSTASAVGSHSTGTTVSASAASDDGDGGPRKCYVEVKVKGKWKKMRVPCN
ncbi:hypothetical protein [Embleya sp. MST-111070]|uniref:hypothetical protein n=1 Tax=Embleya sp. MST-111070 TaxID=3398231 RepID=UPI003F736C29